MYKSNSPKITSIEAILVDIPLRRLNHMSFGLLAKQNYVIVRLCSDAGLEGLGEAAVFPTWGDENPEGIKLVIDKYLVPHLIGEEANRVEHLLHKMEVAARGNHFAKAAVEMALLDLVAKSLDRPVSDLFGGRYWDTLPLACILAAGDTAKDIDEAHKGLDENRFSIFKVKVGAASPTQDVARATAIKQAVGERASVRIDANQAWDEPTSYQCIAELERAGIDVIEQPVPRWNINAMARLSSKFLVSLMADESVCTPQDAFSLAKIAAADVFSLKVLKAGGLTNTKKVAAIAEGAGIPCYGGLMLETSIGTAACAHLFSTIPNITLGCELFGPLLLVDDLTEEGLTYRDKHICIPSGPGYGVKLDEQKLDFYRRDRQRTHVSLT